MVEVLCTLIATIGAMFIGVLALIWHFAVPIVVLYVAVRILKEFAKELDIPGIKDKKKKED